MGAGVFVIFSNGIQMIKTRPLDKYLLKECKNVRMIFLLLLWLLQQKPMLTFFRKQCQ